MDPAAPLASSAPRPGSVLGGLLQWELPQFDTRLPLRLHDFGAITAIYSAATARVRPLLPQPALRPVEMFPGRCLLTFTALEHRASDLGPYLEFVIAVPVSSGPHGSAATALREALAGNGSAWMWQMPVTSERSRRAGIGIAGFPKFIADIAFEPQGPRLACHVRHEGRWLATLSCDTGPARAQRTLHARAYTLKDGQLLQSQLRLHQWRTEEHLHGRAATLQLGDHPLADTLRALDLGTHPLASQYCPEAEGVLYFPRQQGEP